MKLHYISLNGCKCHILPDLFLSICAELKHKKKTKPKKTPKTKKQRKRSVFMMNGNMATKN